MPGLLAQQQDELDSHIWNTHIGQIYWIFEITCDITGLEGLLYGVC